MPSLLSSHARLRKQLHEKLEAKIEAIPLFNVLLIAVLLMLTGSRFIFSPGIPVVLNGNERAEIPLRSENQKVQAIQLPAVGTLLPGAATSAVLTVKSDTMFIFEGHIYENLNEVFSKKNIAGTKESRGVLLVKLDRAVSVQGLFKIAELAGKAGFSSLQIAGESPAFRPAESTTR